MWHILHCNFKIHNKHEIISLIPWRDAYNFFVQTMEGGLNIDLQVKHCFNEVIFAKIDVSILF